MPKYLDTAVNVQELLHLAPVIPVITIRDLEHAAPLARALRAGGLSVLEVTLRTGVALDAIAAMRSAVPDAIVGAGTLTRAADLEAAARAGAQFGVTPGLTPAILEAARETTLPLLPGIMTPGEIMHARAAGFAALKFFPAAPAGGVAMLKAFAGPFPDVLFCPTGGISRASAPDYLRLANVACVGGSWVCPEDLLAAESWSEIEALARDAGDLRP
jgi:2-dehydro-3-deoxyphosphogluconate aldolase/(4S)-4-hydroxy-2-oxoglutarate aldolase